MKERTQTREKTMNKLTLLIVATTLLVLMTSCSMNRCENPTPTIGYTYVNGAVLPHTVYQCYDKGDQ